SRPTRRSAIGTKDFSDPFLDGDVGADEAQLLAVDLNLHALVLGEEGLETLLDSVASLKNRAGLVRVLAIRRPEGGEGLGIAFVKGLHEGLAIFLNGGLRFRVALARLVQTLHGGQTKQQHWN